MKKNNYIDIAEKFFNKKLMDDEIVHHIDGDQNNNDPMNLVIMKKSQHAKLHGGALALTYSDGIEKIVTIGRFKWYEKENKRLNEENIKLRNTIDIINKTIELGS